MTPRAEALTLRGRVRIAPGAAAILIVLAVVAILSTSMRTAVAGTVPIAVGGEAPEIRLGDQHGKTLVLSALLKQRTFVVLAFYPKAFTSGWGAEFSRYREEAGSFLALGAEVVGISADAPERNLAWTRELRLPLRLLSDVNPAGDVGRRYGVWDELWSIARRTTFIVDRRGQVRWVEAGAGCIDPGRTLEALRRLAAQP